MTISSISPLLSFESVMALSRGSKQVLNRSKHMFSKLALDMRHEKSSPSSSIWISIIVYADVERSRFDLSHAVRSLLTAFLLSERSLPVVFLNSLRQCLTNL